MPFLPSHIVAAARRLHARHESFTLTQLIRELGADARNDRFAVREIVHQTISAQLMEDTGRTKPHGAILYRLTTPEAVAREQLAESVAARLGARALHGEIVLDLPLAESLAFMVRQS